MSRIRRPARTQGLAATAWRPEPLAADYSDEISEANLKALRRISETEVADDEFKLVDGPAW